MFQLSEVGKSFGGHSLFRGVTWRINAGDRWGLVGPNGVGKTTLLRMCVGQESMEEGSFSKPREATIGYLAQETRREGAGTVLAAVCAGLRQAAELSAELTRIETEMASTTPGPRMDELVSLYGDAQDRFHALDGFSVETRAKEILAGLGFPEKDFGKSVGELSGGWGMRVELAKLLLARPDLLLMDEPTNHLDLESVLWLEEFLADYHGAWVVVSHDRYFLNRMVDGIAELHSEGMELYAGNYDDFLEEREERRERLQKAADAQARKRSEMERFVERFRYKATKARQAQSRLKALAKMETIEAPRRKKRTLRIRLPEPPRSGETALSLEKVRKAYGPNRIYEGLSLSVRRGERIALLGPNGAGKSTLLKMLAGVVPQDEGVRRPGHNASLFYFAQHNVDALDLSLTVLETLRREMPLEPEPAVRGILGAFLFSGEEVDKKVQVLSGGEKARLALARMLVKPSNMLLLDEPTNHLDLASREVLESALSAFSGTMVFISHDRYFINSIASKVWEVRRTGPGLPSEVVEYPGDYDYWLWKKAREEALAAEAAPAPSGPESGKGADDHARRKEARREEEKKKRQIAQLEKEIGEAETRVKEIDTLLADPSVYADAPRCKALLDERRVLQEKLEPLMSRWSEMAE